MRVLGIDPGLSGGLAICENDVCVGAMDIPTDGEGAKRRVSVGAVRDFLLHQKPAHAFIERAGVMPAQGISSGFIYGRAVGALEAIVLCCDIPLTIIESTAWKKFHGLMGGKSKEASRQRAIHLVPDANVFMTRKKDHGRAEALLIAIYGDAVLRGRNVREISAPSLPLRSC